MYANVRKMSFQVVNYLGSGHQVLLGKLNQRIIIFSLVRGWYPWRNIAWKVLKSLLVVWTNIFWSQVVSNRACLKGLDWVTSFCDTEAFLELRGKLRVGTVKNPELCVKIHIEGKIAFKWPFLVLKSSGGIMFLLHMTKSLKLSVLESVL